MAKNLKVHQPLNESHLNLTHAQSVSHTFPFGVDVLWKGLVDAETWTQWLPIDNVTWTSPEPFGVGTTRTVTVGKDQIEEVFIGWTDGEAMTFYFDKSSLPINGFIEDYRIEKTAGGCKLTWSFCVESNFILRPILNWMMKRNAIKGFPKLESYISQNADKFGL